MMDENRIDEELFIHENEAPMQGVYVFWKDLKFEETLNGYIANQCVAVGVDPDALYKTAKLNAQLQREIEEMRHLAAFRRTESGWIRVKDRLPEPGVKVLVVNTAEEIYIAEYKWESFWLEPDYIDISIVTHWMQLPEPPEVEE